MQFKTRSFSPLFRILHSCLKDCYPDKSEDTIISSTESPKQNISNFAVYSSFLSYLQSVVSEYSKLLKLKLTVIVRRNSSYTKISYLDIAAVRVYINRFTGQFSMNKILWMEVLSAFQYFSTPILQNNQARFLNFFYVPIKDRLLD